MAANESVSLTFEADLSALRKELAQVPGLTKKEADAAVRQLEISYRKAEVAAKKAASAQAKASRQGADATKKATQEAVGGLLELGDAAGFSKDTVEKLGRGMAALANPVTASVAAVGALAIGLGAAAVGAVKLVQAALEAQKALAPFRELEGFQGLSPEAQASLEGANAAMQSLTVVGSRLIEVLGADLAPVVERVAVVAVKLGLALIDSINAAGEGRGIFRDLADDLGELAVRGMFPIITIAEGLILTFAELANAVGADGLANQFYAAGRAIDAFAESAGKDAAGFVLGELDTSFKALETATKDYDARANALIGTQLAVTKATKEGTQANKDAKKAQDDAAEAAKKAAEINKSFERARAGQEAVAEANAKVLETQAELTGSYDDQVAAIQARADRQRAAVDAETAALVELGQTEEALRLRGIRLTQIAVQEEQNLEKARQANAEAQERDRLATIARFEASTRAIAGTVAAAAAAAAAIGQLTSQRAQQELDAVREAREKLGEDITAAEERQLRAREQAAKKGALRGFRISQAAAIAQATVQGAQAILQALTLGPVAGPIAASLLGAAVAAQVAAISSAAPPKFHRGGMVPKPMGDEVMATVLPGEAVLSRQGVRHLGGEAGVRAVNRGEGGGGSGGQIIVTPVMGFGRFVQAELRRPSVLARAVRGTVVSNAGRKGF